MGVRGLGGRSGAAFAALQDAEGEGEEAEVRDLVLLAGETGQGGAIRGAGDAGGGAGVKEK